MQPGLFLDRRPFGLGNRPPQALEPPFPDRRGVGGEGELRRGRQLGQARAPVALRLFNLATVSPVPDDEIPERQADAGEVGPGVLVEFGQFGENGAHAHAVYHSVVEANTDNSTAAINCRESFKAGRFR